MIILFDLDNTVFTTRDKYGNHIWAKQLIEPFSLHCDGDMEFITDDVGSVCSLLPEVKTVIHSLSKAGKRIGYISNGKAMALHDDQQPSKIILQLFQLSHCFNECQILQYKTSSKAELIRSLYGQQKCLVIDDDDRHIGELVNMGIQVIDIKSIKLSMVNFDV